MSNVSVPSRCADEFAAEQFDAIRARLLSVAHRILGNHAEAEDIVQDAWLRWQAYDRSRVLNPTAFLVTTTARLALNAAQSARARHESCVGHWTLEPVDPHGDPALGAERSDLVERGLHLLLERLAPVERAAFVLRQAFEYPYSRIAAILGITEANTRQLVSRAGKRLSAMERLRTVSAAERHALIDAFFGAACGGDAARLESLLTIHVVVAECRPLDEVQAA